MNKVQVMDVIDSSRFNKMHATVLFWCICLILFDGYDLVVFGSVISALKEEWQVSTTILGFINSLTLVGSLIGSLLCGMAADKIGRKKVLIVCIALFSVFTLLTGLTDSIILFTIFRFLAGIGLGGLPPLLVTLTSEYSPKRIRNIMVGIMFSGYSIGGILVSVFGIWVIPNLGWQWMFFIGAIPLLLLPLMIKTLPESVYSYVKQQKYEEAKQVLHRLNPSYIPTREDVLVANMESEGMPVTHLFKEGRGVATILFWTTCFMGLLLVYGLSTWLPQMMISAGYELTSSLLFLLSLNIGAIIGSITGGYLADRIGSKRVLSVLYAGGGVCLIMLGFNPDTWVLYMLTAFAGAASIGAQNLNNAFNSSFYPSYMRSTALGTSLSVGRIGAIIGPSLGGYLLSGAFPVYVSFLVFAIPALIAAITISSIPLKRSFSYQNTNLVNRDSMNKKATIING